MLTWSSWFADVGSESTDAGCASDLFSEASAAAVTCAIMKPELTPPSSTRNGGRPDRLVSISSAMRRSDSAPISAIASARLSAANATGSAWKLPPERISPVVGEHERIVRDRVRFGQRARGRVAHLVEARAHHLRLAAQAVRILHARAVHVRRADRAAVRAARGRSRAASIWPRWPRTAWMRASNGVSLPRHASTVSAPATNAAASARSRGEQAGERERRRHLRAVEQREPFLRRERRPAQGRARASASRAGIDAAVDAAPRLRRSAPPTRCASGARSPDAPTDPCAGNARHDAGIGERDERLDHRPSARPSGRARARPP